jgi:hypothetical protein
LNNAQPGNRDIISLNPGGAARRNDCRSPYQETVEDRFQRRDGVPTERPPDRRPRSAIKRGEGGAGILIEASLIAASRRRGVSKNN